MNQPPEAGAPNPPSLKPKPLVLPNWMAHPAVAAVIGVVAPVVLASLGMNAAAGFAFLGAVLLLVIPKFGEVVEIAFGPLRAKLERKVEETERLLRELRSLGLVLAEPVLTIGVRMGRWNTNLSREERLRLFERTRAALLQLKATDSEIAEASRDHHHFILFDLSRPIAEAIDRALKVKSDARQADINAFPKPIVDLAAWNAVVERHRHVVGIQNQFKAISQISSLDSYPETVRRLIKPVDVWSDIERNALLDAIKDDLEEMEHYVRNRTFRNVEKWLAGGKKG